MLPETRCQNGARSGAACRGQRPRFERSYPSSHGGNALTYTDLSPLSQDYITAKAKRTGSDRSGLGRGERPKRTRSAEAGRRRRFAVPVRSRFCHRIPWPRRGCRRRRLLTRQTDYPKIQTQTEQAGGACSEPQRGAEPGRSRAHPTRRERRRAVPAEGRLCHRPVAEARLYGADGFPCVPAKEHLSFAPFQLPVIARPVRTPVAAIRFLPPTREGESRDKERLRAQDGLPRPRWGLAMTG